MSGAEFLARYDGTSDTVTTVLPERRYRVRAATAHPVYERRRAETFRKLLIEWSGDQAGVALGTLMYESHASYGRCGLGSQGTDRLVELVKSAGPDTGLYGARITGGGSGGTVAVLGRPDASAADCAHCRPVRARDRSSSLRFRRLVSRRCGGGRQLVTL